MQLTRLWDSLEFALFEVFIIELKDESRENKTRMTSKIFIGIGVATIAVFFTSIVVTVTDMIKYENSRFVTYSTMLIAVSLYWIYILCERKQ